MRPFSSPLRTWFTIVNMVSPIQFHVRRAHSGRAFLEGEFHLPQAVHLLIADEEVLAIGDVDRLFPQQMPDGVVVFPFDRIERLVDVVLAFAGIAPARAAEHVGDHVAHGVVAAADQDEIPLFQGLALLRQLVDGQLGDAITAGAAQADVAQVGADIAECNLDVLVAGRITAGQQAMVIGEGDRGEGMDEIVFLVPWRCRSLRLPIGQIAGGKGQQQARPQTPRYLHDVDPLVFGCLSRGGRDQ